VLAQYDTPDAILAHPADDFVAQFVGEDRALRRLALRTLRDVTLEPGSQSEPGSRVSPDTTVRNAVSLMLETGDEQLVVVDGDRVLGVFHLRDAGELL
jgi:osmoprotectant transport system ATP-binding protein